MSIINEHLVNININEYEQDHYINISDILEHEDNLTILYTDIYEEEPIWIT